MKTIGIRELRQRASVVLREVEGGVSFEVTDRGRPVCKASLSSVIREARRFGLLRLRFSEAGPRAREVSAGNFP
jgi:antitoxin (DNA-binding transcriptional repressor) of toxin-antitoxin stability system